VLGAKHPAWEAEQSGGFLGREVRRWGKQGVPDERGRSAMAAHMSDVAAVAMVDELVRGHRDLRLQ
jgi:hypothetical protein